METGARKPEAGHFSRFLSLVCVFQDLVVQLIRRNNDEMWHRRIVNDIELFLTTAG